METLASTYCWCRRPLVHDPSATGASSPLTETTKTNYTSKHHGTTGSGSFLRLRQRTPVTKQKGSSLLHLLPGWGGVTYTFPSTERVQGCWTLGSAPLDTLSLPLYSSVHLLCRQNTRTNKDNSNGWRTVCRGWLASSHRRIVEPVKTHQTNEPPPHLPAMTD